MKTKERTCKRCLKIFLADINVINQGKGHYCSKQCSIAARRTAQTKMLMPAKYKEVSHG